MRQNIWHNFNNIQWYIFQAKAEPGHVFVCVCVCIFIVSESDDKIVDFLAIEYYSDGVICIFSGCAESNT